MKKKKIILWNPKPYSEDGKTGQEMNSPPLALGILASLTPDHYDVIIRDGKYDKHEYEESDLVGITAMTCQAITAYEIATIFKKKNIPVVMGGIHATMCEEEALNYVDAVVKGEAEYLWPDLLNDFENGKLKKIYHSKKFHDLKNLPIPPYDKFNKKYRMGIIQTTRGCPFNCEFCAVTAFNGRTYRKRPIDEVLNELEKIPNKFIFFADDNMYGNSKKDHERFIKLCNGIIERKIKKYWITQVSLNFSEDEKAMTVAKKAGCRLVLLGIESVSKDVITGNMSKKINLKYIKDVNFVQKIHKNGIIVLGTFIVGNDEDDEGCFENTYNAIKELKIDLPSIWSLTPHPGTRLYDRLKESNRLLYTNYPNDWSYHSYKRVPLFKLKKLNNDTFQRNLYLIVMKVYSISNIFYRAIRCLFYCKSFVVAFAILFMGFSVRKAFKIFK
jgi:radical SAM superfamily enzyme YgiQ (UPF0313 family)